MNPQERRDSAWYAAGEGLWGGGMGLLATLTVLPILLKDYLGAGALELGVFQGIVMGGWLLTQPLGMFLWDHGGGKRNFLIWYHVAVALPPRVLIGVLLLAYGTDPTMVGFLRWTVIIGMSVIMLCIGPIVSLWQDWLAGLFATQSRGRAIGMAGAASAIGVTLGSLAAGAILGRLSYPANYACLFLVAPALLSVSLGAFGMVSRGTPRPGPRRRPRWARLLIRFRRSLRERAFRQYLVARILLTTGAGFTAFVAVHFRGEGESGIPAGAVVVLGALLPAFQTLSAYLLGLLGDRRGHRLGAVIGALAQGGAVAALLCPPGPVVCGISFALLGVATGAAFTSHQNMIYETCPHDNRIAHITLSSIVLGPFVAAVPVLTGAACSLVGNAATFMACSAATLCGILWLALMVPEPRDVPLAGGRRRTRPTD